ncbi:LOW QUALITY PROTEIN: uncharacterized protein [Argopecten irradians]|uniref:LOW QUALITY PROTEIN: uncharacterized protein n=1 Tax=Argopecten irradians TaxID=31199 RepID=UPI00371F8108
MGFVALLLLAVGLTRAIEIEESVIFQKINDITTTRSRWLVSFVIDLKPYERFMSSLTDIMATSKVVRRVKQRYKGSKNVGYVNIVDGLKQMLKDIKRTQKTILESFLNYALLEENTREGNFGIIKQNERSKRSLLPFVGSALSFLFDTVSDSDLGSIRHNVNVLAKNQKDITHALKDSLSILNVTRVEVKENRNTINELINSADDLEGELLNFTTELGGQLQDMNDFVQIFAQLDRTIDNIKLMSQRAMFYLENLQLQINMLSLGHLSPSIVSPDNLLKLLSGIEQHLPYAVRLPHDPEKHLWDYYRYLTCTTVLVDEQILVVISIPLLDVNGRFDIYKVHSLPVPRVSPNISSNSIGMTAQYQIESKYIAVNAERTQYMLLSETEGEGCSNSLIKFCKIESPIYPINLANLCVTSLFLKRRDLIKVNCQATVRPHSVLPIAEYVTDGMWVVATQHDLTFTVVCYKGHEKVVSGHKSLTVHRPMGVVKLDKSCSASNHFLTLVPFYHEESQYNVNDPFQDLLSRYNFSVNIWKPFQLALPNFTITNLPKELGTLENIPMNNLIDKLNNLSDIDTDVDAQGWIYIVIGIIILIVLGIILYCYFKGKCSKLGLKPWSVNKRISNENAKAVPSYEMALLSTNENTHGGGEDDHSAMTPVMPTAPSSSEQRAVVGSLYPTTLQLNAEGLGRL